MQKEKSKNGGALQKRYLPIVLVILLALVAILGQNIIMTRRMAQAAEEARQEALAEAGAQEKTIVMTDETEIDAATLREVIAPASKLTSYEYYYTNADVYLKDKKLFKKVKIPFTTDKTVFTYTGKISAGVDLKEVEVDVDNVQKQITVKMPQPKILSHEINRDGFKYYDVKNSIFTSSDLGDYTELCTTLMETQELGLKENETFWQNAKDSAEETVKALITATGKIGQYKIIFEWAE